MYLALYITSSHSIDTCTLFHLYHQLTRYRYLYFISPVSLAHKVSILVFHFTCISSVHVFDTCALFHLYHQLTRYRYSYFIPPVSAIASQKLLFMLIVLWNDHSHFKQRYGSQQSMFRNTENRSLHRITKIIAPIKL